MNGVYSLLLLPAWLKVHECMHIHSHRTGLFLSNVCGGDPPTSSTVRRRLWQLSGGGPPSIELFFLLLFCFLCICFLSLAQADATVAQVGSCHLFHLFSFYHGTLMAGCCCAHSPKRPTTMMTTTDAMVNSMCSFFFAALIGGTQVQFVTRGRIFSSFFGHTLSTPLTPSGGGQFSPSSSYSSSAIER